MSTQKEKNKGIIINRMYAGSYLSQHIGHEAINLLQADNEQFYVYVNPYGTVSRQALNYDTMLLVRHAGTNLFEVVGIAKGLKKADNVENPGNNSKLTSDTFKAQKNYISRQKDGGVRYNGVDIMDIFGTPSMQDVYITYKATEIREPKQRIFLYYKNSKETNEGEIEKTKSKYTFDYKKLPGKVVILNQNGWPRQSLKTYITPKQSDNEKSDYEKIVSEIIEDKSLWKEECVKMADASKRDIKHISLFDICRIQDNENCISNALAYFMMDPKYRNLWKEIFNNLWNIHLSDNFQVEREVDAKIKANDKTGGRIDILITDDNNVIVIEIKIKSDINTVKTDSPNSSQLDRYYNFINLNEKYSRKTKYFILLSPPYNTPEMRGEMVNLYNKEKTFRDIYEYLIREDVSEAVEKDSNFLAFRDLLKRHVQDTPNGYLYDEMMEKFYNRIKELK